MREKIWRFYTTVVQPITQEELYLDGVKQRDPKVSDDIEIYWSFEQKFYTVKFTGYSLTTKEHHLIYNDDGVKEDKNLMNHHWRFLDRAINGVRLYERVHERPRRITPD